MDAHYFIGISLPKEVSAHLSRWQREIKQHAEYKNWTNPEDLHITLKFLGATSEKKVKQLCNELVACGDVSPFSLNIEGFGFFGNPSSPRVIWAGVEKARSLLLLQERIEQVCSKLGFEKETRTYKPHITLAKKWQDSSSIHPELDAILKQKDWLETFEVNTFTLFKIHPKQTPKYEVVQNISLSPENV
ncbi:RNA 2',3'-cyclic phosphodiesterase [Pontibacillus yanchengensis]|uniref:RNA 2',3'-cyclic phosphodiesterase n=1 Tax=Pontibacillus yanchengensis Y32 TaxID=1385514 RepID=A0A0A2TPF7_9BACI|nr:RNA 2',3'-cyclic phosphodiesterase [Pontibacillus yanchengensis]KGP71220.1 ABC transporter permease [Pontibacillus yanchengensis Y32]